MGTVVLFVEEMRSEEVMVVVGLPKQPHLFVCRVGVSWTTQYMLLSTEETIRSIQFYFSYTCHTGVSSQFCQFFKDFPPRSASLEYFVCHRLVYHSTEQHHERSKIDFDD